MTWAAGFFFSMKCLRLMKMLQGGLAENDPPLFISFQGLWILSSVNRKYYWSCVYGAVTELRRCFEVLTYMSVVTCQAGFISHWSSNFSVRCFS